jgi:hypothetical protein
MPKCIARARIRLPFYIMSQLISLRAKAQPPMSAQLDYSCTTKVKYENYAQQRRVRRTITAFSLILTLFLPLSVSAPALASDKEWKTHYAVSEFVNPGQPEPREIFKIHYRVLNGMVEQFHMPYGEYAHHIQAKVSGGSGTLEIMFPKNYPSANADGGGEAIVFVGEREVAPEYSSANECFYEFSISFSGPTTVELLWADFLTGEPLRGVSVPDSCLPETTVQQVAKTRDGIIAPLHQVRSGVLPSEVVCGDGFELVSHPDGRPYCVTPNSIEQLIDRWYRLPPPSPPVSQYPLLDNVTSYISAPFTIVQNQSTSTEFRIQNDNDFPIYDVQIHNFSAGHIPMILSNTFVIDVLQTHESRTIIASLATEPGYSETGAVFLTWTVLAKDSAGNMMESTLFQSLMTVVGDNVR